MFLYFSNFVCCASQKIFCKTFLFCICVYVEKIRNRGYKRAVFTLGTLTKKWGETCGGLGVVTAGAPAWLPDLGVALALALTKHGRLGPDVTRALP